MKNKLTNLTHYVRVFPARVLTGICALAIFAVFPGSNAFGAGFIGPGSHPAILRAADVLKASDDAPCILEGRILARIEGRKNRYLFEDSSGQVIVEIKKKTFGNQTITPQSRVRLEGEVDVDDKYPNEMEVDSITILQP